MAKKHELKPSAPWYRIEVDESDWSSLPARDLVRLYAQMKLIRRFEEKILDLGKAGLSRSTGHAH